jgi:hypothetical protein
MTIEGGIMTDGKVPQWFSSLTDLGRFVASQPNTLTGDKYPVIVLSVPTGQFVVWALTNGAFAAKPKIEAPVSFPSRCVAWNKSTEQVEDVEASVVPYKGTIEEFKGRDAIKIGDSSFIEYFPLVSLPEAVPLRTGRVLVKKVADQIRADFLELKIATEKKHWYVPWTEHCLSPIVIVGDGQEYLLNQLEELREDPLAESWLSPLTKTLTSFSSGKVTEPDHLLRLPFSVLSQSATKNVRWINQVKPRLVIYTRWSYFKRRPPSAFSGVPTVVITNRRVDASVVSAYETQNVHKAFPEWLQPVSFPRGVSCRFLEYSTVPYVESDDDSGDFDEDDF